MCEKYLTDTVSRSKTDRRYTLSMPLIEEPTVFVTSRKKSTQQVSTICKDIIEQPGLHIEYNVFMKDYEQLKHMTLVVNDTQITP